MKLQEHLKTAEQHPISTLQQTLWRVAESIGSGVQFLSLNAGFFTQLFDLGQVIESGNTGITGKLPLETFSHLKVAPQWELPGGPQKAKEATMDKPRCPWSEQCCSLHAPSKTHGNVYHLPEVNQETYQRDFPSGPVVKNPPSNAGDTVCIPGWGSKIPHAMEQVNQCAATREKQQKILSVAVKARHSQINK